jgi:DNA-directed RNA polymerase specialized sigma24 family protein
MAHHRETDAAVARVALSYEACLLAEAAAAAVPAAADELAAARSVLEATNRYVAAVVALARLRGISWQQIAAAVGLSAETVRSVASPDRDWWRAHLLEDPNEAAADLDDWVLRHVDGVSDPTPVSKVLASRATV